MNRGSRGWGVLWEAGAVKTGGPAMSFPLSEMQLWASHFSPSSISFLGNLLKILNLSSSEYLYVQKS